MENKFMNGLKTATNFGLTENGAVMYRSTLNGLMDLFALGGAYRNRSDADCITLFKAALEEDEVHALRCLFYLRDIRGGQGERRFFRVVIRWLANEHPEMVRRNLQYIPEFGRWDDLYALAGTPLEKDAFDLMYHQLALDVECKTPSLLGKWLKSENTSSKESRKLGEKTRLAFGMTPKQYRLTLSTLRGRIRIVEKLMSENRWNEIEFDKIPSRAGLIYRNAFARHDLIKEKYEAFAKSKETKVKASTLYPYEVVSKAFNMTRYGNVALDNTKRLMVNKYWDNLTDYFNGASLDALCVVDTSGSMWGSEASAPINVAISLGLYAAEKARGPFAGHYVSFSSRPQLIETAGVDFVDKVKRIYSTNLCENTNIEATFDMLLNTAISNHCTQEDLPKSIVVISDFEFDAAVQKYYGRNTNTKTLMENISNKWAAYGYKMPNLVFWCVESRHNNVPMRVKDGVTLMSGFSPVLFQQLMTGKTGYEFMMDKLDSDRYKVIG